MNSLNFFVAFLAFFLKNHQINSQDPRIITDLEVIYGCRGVPVEYWFYNETTNPEDNHFGSVPGCPQSIDGIPWIYYGNPPRCYLADHNGPCPPGQKLMLEKESPYGVCACDCVVDDEEKENLLRNPKRYLSCGNTSSEFAQYGQIYDKEMKKCYKLLKDDPQGPCEKGTVIAEFTADSVNCLPICDFKNTYNYEETESWSGLCTVPPSRGGTTSSLVKNEGCSENMQYSNLLRKCVKKFKSFYQVGK